MRFAEVFGSVDGLEEFLELNGIKKEDIRSIVLVWSEKVDGE